MRFSARLLQLQDVLKGYRYPLPFAQHLKHYFKDHPKMGSRDRRELSELSWQYLRLGTFLPLPFEEQAAIANLVLDGGRGDELKEWVKEPLFSQITPESRLEDKLEILKHDIYGFTIDRIFPFAEHLSAQFRNKDFMLYHLQQPFVWIRAQKNKISQVEAEFNRQQIGFEKYRELIWKLSPQARLTETDSFKKGYFRVQDLSSQSTAEVFRPLPNEAWWDCCAGAGGKSLALMEIEPSIRLYASDFRESILDNLKERHRLAGNKALTTFQADLTKPLERKLPQFDCILTDVPCTGSGTWARNPENLSYFNPQEIESFHSRQLSILMNVFPYLKKGKPLVYISCSVFKRENEDVIEAFCREMPAEIEEQKYLEGYKAGAENMFLCRLKKTDDDPGQ